MFAPDPSVSIIKLRHRALFVASLLSSDRSSFSLFWPLRHLNSTLFVVHSPLHRHLLNVILLAHQCPLYIRPIWTLPLFSYTYNLNSFVWLFFTFFIISGHSSRRIISNAPSNVNIFIFQKFCLFLFEPNFVLNAIVLSTFALFFWWSNPTPDWFVFHDQLVLGRNCNSIFGNQKARTGTNASRACQVSFFNVELVVWSL